MTSASEPSMLRPFFFAALGTLAGLPAAIAQTPPPRVQYPVTRTVEHVDDYGGTKVADPYRWLESIDSAGV